MRSMAAAVLIILTATAGKVQAQGVALSNVIENLIAPDTVLNLPGPLAGVGHVPHFEAPEKFYPPLLAFLKEGL